MTNSFRVFTEFLIDYKQLSIAIVTKIYAQTACTINAIKIMT